MAKRVFGTFDEVTFGAANTTVDDLIDAAFTIGTPTILEITLGVKARGDDGSGNEWGYSFGLTINNYHSTTVNTTLKNNLDPVWTEWEDTVTDSGKYSTVERVWGSVTITAIE